MLNKVRNIWSSVRGSRSVLSDEPNPLFSFTSGRWLSNNDAHNRSRYAPFNVEGLRNVASRTVGSKIESMEKIAESLNRVFLLTFTSGQQVVARIPTPICGPPHFTTASEVATMDFLRRLGMPIPKVLAWSSRAQATEVESEFIIMEKAEGIPLSKLWDKVDRMDLVNKLVQLHRPLIDLRFSHYGSLYYKKDIDGPHVSVADIVKDLPGGLDISPFCIGPISRREFWEDERAVIAAAARGPWTSARDYMVDVAYREQQWIDQHAKPHLHDDYLCVLPLQGKQDDHIEMLEYYKYVLSKLIPTDRQYLDGHLWHPDLHTSNLHVVPSGMVSDDGKIRVNIMSCLDWQGAWVGPAFLQLTIPAMLRSQGVGMEALCLPPNFESLDTKTRAQLSAFHEEAVLQKHFETLAFPFLSQLPALEELRQLEELSHLTWRTGLLPFRELLIKLWKKWDAIAPHTQFPMTFTPSECEEHEKVFASWCNHREFAESLNEEFSLEEFGYVEGDQAQFSKVKQELEKRKQEWIRAAKTAEGRSIKELMWPYRDTLSDHPRSHLKVDPERLTQM